MKKIFKIISKHSLKIIIIIGILISQAMCDLKLPEYTADIVNVGIAQDGISSPVPEIISADDFENILLLITKDEQNIISQSFTLISEENFSSKEISKINKKYDYKNEEAYLLNSKDDTKLEKIFYQVNILYATLIQEQYEHMFSNTVDSLTYLSSVDYETRQSILSEIKDNVTNNMPTQITDSLAISAVTSFYNNLNITISNIQMNYILIEGLKMLGIACLAMALTVLSAFLISRLAAVISKDLRRNVVHKVMNYANQEFEEFQTSSLITRTTNDIQQIQMFIVMALRIVIYAPIMGIGAFTKVSSNQMSWVIGISILCVLSLVIILFSISLPKFRSIQNKIDKLNLISREILTGIPVIRAFATEKHEEKRFDKANKDLTKTNLFVNRTMNIMMPTMMFIMNGTSILIVYAGSKYIDLGTMQIGDILAIMTYSMHVIMSFLMFSLISIMMPRAIISLRRVGEIFNKDSSINDPINPENFKKESRGVVEFKDVYFRYPDAEEDVIENISFIAEPGTTTAFIGSTGSGKSTLINLIPRFYDVTAGKILIDGVNVKNVKLEKLRSKIGYVPQKGMLFSGTIASNIGFGLKKKDEEAIKKAAEVAQATEFILDKPQKYDSEISQGGTNVSGGQRQRLAIARAIAKNPEIYIFDDSFSALDYKTDSKLRKELAKITKQATIFIVAQRISTIMHADQIIVLDQGQIVGKGTHQELLKNCDIYKEIALSQLSEEELTNE